MVELITRDIPFICTVSAKDLNAADRFMLEKIHKVSVDNFILVDHKKDCIFINKDLDNVSEVKELIIKIMHSKYLPEKLSMNSLILDLGFTRKMPNVIISKAQKTLSCMVIF